MINILSQINHTKKMNLADGVSIGSILGRIIGMTALLLVIEATCNYNSKNKNKNKSKNFNRIKIPIK